MSCDLNTLRKIVDKYQIEYSHAERILHSAGEKVERAEKDYRNAVKAQEITQQIAQATQQQAHAQIATVVGRCLDAVFGEEAYDFQIMFERKRGKTEARLVFLRDGDEIDPLEGSGGGVIDVAAFALRIAALIATRPPARRLLILDEPVKMLSKEYSERFRELLEALSEEMGIQILLITHNEEIATGKVIMIED